MLGKRSLLQETFKRLDALDLESSVVVCNEEHRFLVAEQLREFNGVDSIILEPEGRNTAPAIALAALLTDNDPLLLVLSADHYIKDELAFVHGIKKAVPLAEQGKLVTFGVLPTEPHSGYGYIMKGDKIGEGFEVENFIEKPSIGVARDYFVSRKYLWNSGMFLFRASKYLEELQNFRPDIFEVCEKAVDKVEADLDFIRISRDIFLNCPSDSVDYAVMEKTKNAVVVEIDPGWSDIGSFASLWDVSKKDELGNSLRGDVLTHKTSNSLIFSDYKLVGSVGVSDLLIVSTKDAVLVANKNNAQDVKDLVKQLEDQGRCECELHREVCRPWGKYDSLDTGVGYQVKIITVNPGEKLSVQMHYHRSEHWVVVAGEARVHYGNEYRDLKVNQSTYHGIEVLHALENIGDIPLKLIEVQVGDYLGEDDIVRFEDRYGRE